jgi:hypothetical protein
MLSRIGNANVGGFNRSVRKADATTSYRLAMPPGLSRSLLIFSERRLAVSV